MKVRAGSRFEARGYAAFLQNAGLFFGVNSQSCTLVLTHKSLVADLPN
jgi:hypothetical protein